MLVLSGRGPGAPEGAVAAPGHSFPSAEPSMKEERAQTGTSPGGLLGRGRARPGPDLWTPPQCPPPALSCCTQWQGVGVKGHVPPACVTRTSWPGRRHHGPGDWPQDPRQSSPTLASAPCPSATLPPSSNIQGPEASRNPRCGVTPSARGQAGHPEDMLQLLHWTGRQSIF